MKFGTGYGNFATQFPTFSNTDRATLQVRLLRGLSSVFYCVRHAQEN
jgi:hypothetical protein